MLFHILARALNDLPRSGKLSRYGHDERLNLVNVACNPPSLQTRWTVRELAQKTGIGKSQWHRIMHELDLKPHHFRMWLFSSDPEFESKQADIIYDGRIDFKDIGTVARRFGQVDP